MLFGAAPASADSANESSQVFIARRGWHIDIGLSVADLSSPLNSIAADLPEARYVFFGFGDQHYLLSKKHNAPAMLGALWPGGGLVLVTGLAGLPDQAFGADHVVQLQISADELLALRSFIWRSMITHEDKLNVYQTGPYEDSVYYLASTQYSAFHTCNTWAAQALRISGLPVHSGGVLFAGQLWSQVKHLKREQTAHKTPRASLLSPPLAGKINGRGAKFHPDTPPSCSSPGAPPPWSLPALCSAVPRPWSSPAAAVHCC
jgi:hypothetical protein